MCQRAGHQSWTPPPNFALVHPGVYRSAYPTLASVSYLRYLGIKTVVRLSIELFPGPVARALASNDPTASPQDINLTRKEESEHTNNNNNSSSSIRVVCVAELSEWMRECATTREDFAVSDVHRALIFALQTDFQPVLLTCPTGDLQTSVVVGCMRRYQGWTVAAAIAECELFLNISQTVRPSIMRFIERWDPSEQPVHEADLASRKFELLSKERRHDHYKRRRQKEASHAIIDTDSENEDSITPTSIRASVKRNILMNQTTNNTTTSQRELDGNYKSSSDWNSSSHIVRENGDESIASPSSVAKFLAPWYTNALDQAAKLEEELLKAKVKSKTRNPQDPLPEPHERYFGVLNPPALDERSTFTKESIVEEDDD